jgi:glycosyltransferase involved in cell wall biosynthesis
MISHWQRSRESSPCPSSGLAGRPSDVITVGVAAYNAARTLPQLLDSLRSLASPARRIEIIVADNRSTDETPVIVEEYARRSPIKLVQAGPRRGPAVARNAIIAAASGEIVAFIDADCVAERRWLVEIERAFLDPAVGCVAGKILPTEPRTATEQFYARHGLHTQEAPLAHPFLPCAATANAAFRRELLRLVGGFDEEMTVGEDVELIWRIQLQTAFRLVYRPTALVWHRNRDSPGALARQSMGWGMADVLLYRKYGHLMAREPWRKVVKDYYRIVQLARLATWRWIWWRLGQTDREALEDACFYLVMCAGIKIGGWQTSLRAHAFYP